MPASAKRQSGSQTPQQASANSSAHSNPYSMTEEILRKRLSKPHYGRVAPQIFMGFLTCLSSLSFGTTLGWPYTISHEVKQERNFDGTHGWLVSIALLGCSFGVTLGTFLMQQMGPKRVLRIIGPLYIFNWVLIIIGTRSLELTGRFFLGFLSITYASAGETLLCHSVHYRLRRYMMVFQSCTIMLGVLLLRVVSAVISRFHVSVVCVCIPVLHYVLIQIVPESPVFLYATSYQAAESSLTWYRGKDNFYEDMAVIKKDWDITRLDPDAYKYMLFSKVVFRPILVLIALVFFQIYAGYFIFVFYNMTAWDTGDNKFYYDKFFDAVIVGTCFVVTKLLWGLLHAIHPNWKVRGFLITSFFFSSLILGLMTTFIILREYKIDLCNVLPYCHWFPLMLVCSFLFFYDMGINVYTKTLTFEYMPVQVYKKVDSLIQAIYWFLAFIFIYSFDVAFAKVGSYYNLGVYSIITLLGALFSTVFIIEPRGRSLIQIQLQFGGNPIGTRGAIYNQIRHTV